MATEASAGSATPAPYTQGHKRSKTAILRAIVSPHKAHKKSASVSQEECSNSNPLNSYMHHPNIAPPVDTEAPLLPPLGLEPPMAPFAQEDRRKRMHKKSLSSISLSSMKSKKLDEPSSPSAPASPSRGSFDISGALRDLMGHNRGNVDVQKPGHVKKPSKSKSAIDINILRRKQDKKETKPGVKDNKENRQPPRDPLTPMSPRSIHGMFTRHATAGASPQMEPEEFAPSPKIYASGGSRPRLNTNHSDSAVDSITQPRGSTSSDERFVSSRVRETEELMKRYTPTEYTPSSQRSFYAHEPALVKPADHDSRSSSKSRSSKPRPKSSFIPSEKTGFSIVSPRKSLEVRRSVEDHKLVPPPKISDSPSGSHSSRGSKESGRASLDLEGIEIAFEDLLVSIPSPTVTRLRFVV
jgi:hypothetical protein